MRGPLQYARSSARRAPSKSHHPSVLFLYAGVRGSASLFTTVVDTRARTAGRVRCHAITRLVCILVKSLCFYCLFTGLETRNHHLENFRVCCLKGLYIKRRTSINFGTGSSKDLAYRLWKNEAFQSHVHKVRLEISPISALFYGHSMK